VRQLADFALERYFARYEFAVRHVAAASDIEPVRMSELLAMADDDMRQQWDALRLGYTESAGLPALRHEIAALYAGLDSADTIVCSGAEEAIFLAMHALLAPGDHAVVSTPAYQSLHEVPRSVGAAVTAVELDPAGWTFDLDRFTAAFRDSTRVAVVNFPHNPTGAHLDEPTFRELAARCEARGITLFSDEVYRGLEHDGPSLPAAATLGQRTVSLGVMSKAYGLAGIRIGWLATRDRTVLARVAALKDYTTICNAAPSELLAVMGLRAHTRLVARSRGIIAGNLLVVRDFLAQRADRIGMVEPAAGSTCFPAFTRVDADGVADRLVRDAGVLVLPGSQFGAHARHFRLGLGRTDLPQALELAAPVLDALS
jgi:aspartate/methionine/tyrosine aminotransferase